MFSSIESYELQSFFYLCLLIPLLYLLKYIFMDLIRPAKSSIIKENVLDLKDVKRFKDCSLMLDERSADKYKERIAELERSIGKLKEENDKLQKTVRENDENKTSLTGVIGSYENMLEKLMQEHQLVKGERDKAKFHLANLELAFHDLVEKYERAKTIIKGFEDNERSFRTHLKCYEEAVAKLEKKYADFKSYAVDKLNEANGILKKNDREYLQEVAKLKAKIIHSQVKISELERQVARMFLKSDSGSIKSESFIFEPLVNNIS